MFSIPNLKNSLDIRRRIIQNKFDQAPRSFADNPEKLLDLFGEFLSKINNLLSGTLDLELFQWLKEQFCNLKQQLQSTRLKFDVKSGCTTVKNEKDGNANGDKSAETTGKLFLLLE